MENINDLITTKEAELKQIFADLKISYRAVNQSQRDFENARGEWEFSHHAATGEWVYGSSAKVRKLWSADLAATAGLANDLKATHKRLTATSRELRAEILQLKRSKKQAFRETNGAECQICARLILAQNGMIAHHGYTRPRGRGMWHQEGRGYQTPSCPGALRLPYERSCEILKPYLADLVTMLSRDEAYLLDLKQNPPAEIADPYRLDRRMVARPDGDFRYTEYGRFYEDKIWNLENTVRELRETVAFQTERVHAWKLRELNAMTVANF